MQTPQPGKVWRVSFMHNSVQGADFEGLREGFARLGFAEVVAVAFFAAAVAGPPNVRITSTSRRTKSAANDGCRSSWCSANLGSKMMF
jgi:hypothetical protein